MKKATFLKWELNGVTRSVIMRSPDDNEWEIGASNFQAPNITMYDWWLERKGYTNATKEEFVEMYNKINAIMTAKMMINL